MERLVTLRTKRGLSQKKAAEKIGISQSYLAMLESGERRGSDKTKMLISDFYRLSVGEIFFDSKITKRDNAS